MPTTVVFHFTSDFFSLFHFHIILSYQKFCWQKVCVPSPEYPLFHQVQYLTAWCLLQSKSGRLLDTHEDKKEKEGDKKRRGEKMDGARRKRAKVRVRSMSVSCYLCCPQREWEEKGGGGGIIPSAESFLFISHSWVTTSSVHLPLALLSSLSLSSVPSSLLSPFLYISLFLGASLVCSCTQMSATSCSLFTEHVGWNVCVSALYLCISVHPYVYGCGLITVAFVICWIIDPCLHCAVYTTVCVFVWSNCLLK